MAVEIVILRVIAGIPFCNPWHKQEIVACTAFLFILSNVIVNLFKMYKHEK